MLSGKELQGNEAVQACIFGLVNDAHATATEFLHDAVVRNGLTNHREGIRCGRMLGFG